jgi:hypothetical protein
VLLCATTICSAQQDTIKPLKKDRYGIWLIPSWSKNIYGIAIGPVGNEAACGVDYTKRTHGLNIQVPGQGFFQVAYFNIGLPNATEVDVKNMHKITIHNGLMVSVLGTFTDQINGISISGFMSMGKLVNGISINPFWNKYLKVNGITIGLINTTVETNGIQVGLINITQKMKGLQIGLWNVNDKRSLPFINW